MIVIHWFFEWRIFYKRRLKSQPLRVYHLFFSLNILRDIIDDQLILLADPEEPTAEPCLHFLKDKLPLFCEGSCPGHIKHVAATWWRSTSFQSAIHTVFESVLLTLLDWSWKSLCLTIPFASIDTPWSGKVAGTRFALTDLHGWCCFDRGQSCKHKESNVCSFKTGSLWVANVETNLKKMLK
jgi:hypothetical protein